LGSGFLRPIRKALWVDASVGTRILDAGPLVRSRPLHGEVFWMETRLGSRLLERFRSALGPRVQGMVVADRGKMRLEFIRPYQNR